MFEPRTPRPDPPRRRRGSRVRRFAALGLALLCLSGFAVGCAQYATGHYHTVSRGENLYRIGKRYGVDPRTIARVNGIDDVTTLSVGQKVWIPKQQEPGAQAASRRPSGPPESDRRHARRDTDLQFGWPVSGARITSRFGRRGGRPHEGIDLGARPGTRIRAAESGKVIHSGWLGDYGKVVIVKHVGDYRSVYAHARKLHVKKGQFVDRGQTIAEVGSTGRATGPHLHFEIRRRASPRDPMLYLP